MKATLAINLMFAAGQPARVAALVQRTAAQQDSLYAVGRTTELNRDPVTDARGGQSAHESRPSEAMDVYPTEGGRIVIPSAGDPRWAVMGAMGKMAGLNWGGDWRRRVDKTHFELPGWQTN